MINALEWTILVVIPAGGAFLIAVMLLMHFTGQLKFPMNIVATTRYGDTGRYGDTRTVSRHRPINLDGDRP